MSRSWLKNITKYIGKYVMPSFSKTLDSLDNTHACRIA